ncbi:MAG: IS1380 family transposase [Lentisphaeria bacterium]
MMRSDKPGRPAQEPQGILPFEIEATGEPEDITARAGLPLVQETMMALGVDELVREQVKIRERRSGYSEQEHVEALVLLLAAGGECLDDLQVLGADRGLLQLLGKEQWPSPEASRQFLHAFHDEKLLAKARREMERGETALLAPESAALASLGRVLVGSVRNLQRMRPGKVATLELDATCIESRKREATPLYTGGRGYQPEVVYWVEQDVVVADEFRDGNVPAGKGPLEVVRRAFGALPDSVEQRRFRADSAAYEEHLLKWLAAPAQRIERFTVSADLCQELRSRCEALPDADWHPYESRPDETVSWSEVEYTPGRWTKDSAPLRTLVKRIQKRQGLLFANGAERLFVAVVTNDRATDGAELLRWHYQKAGHIEIVHDVLKNELGAGVLPCGAFGANAAWFRLCCLTYNVLSALKTLGLPPHLADARPKRLRFSVFHIPARLVSHARQLLARAAAVLCEACQLLAARGRLRALWRDQRHARPMAVFRSAPVPAPA